MISDSLFLSLAKRKKNPGEKEREIANLFIFQRGEFIMVSETVTVPKKKYETLRREVKALKNSRLYRRLLEFHKNISSGKEYSREDLGF
ncbi:MAG: hypothetical protein AABW99_02535 [archaeon]